MYHIAVSSHIRSGFKAGNGKTACYGNFVVALITFNHFRTLILSLIHI